MYNVYMQRKWRVYSVCVRVGTEPTCSPDRSELRRSARLPPPENMKISIVNINFAGEKPFQISRKLDPLRSNYCVLARIVCIYYIVVII